MNKLAPLPNRPLPMVGFSTARTEKPVLAAAGNPNRIMRNEGDPVSLAGQGNELLAHDQLMYFDYNFHSLKKAISSTMLDVALLMANVSQLKTVYLSDHNQPFFIALMVLLISSIILQILAALLMIFLGRININVPDSDKHRQAELLANIALVAIFLLTVVNIFISALGISSEGPPPRKEPLTTPNTSNLID